MEDRLISGGFCVLPPTLFFDTHVLLPYFSGGSPFCMIKQAPAHCYVLLCAGKKFMMWLKRRQAVQFLRGFFRWSLTNNHEFEKI
ncbi:MAG: hypothetical protein IJU12_08285 [Clostridia bacterium]|nr:hypothetical protein [Clostridia bacterium]